jgi:hypothetical protein
VSTNPLARSCRVNSSTSRSGTENAREHHSPSVLGLAVASAQAMATA